MGREQTARENGQMTGGSDQVRALRLSRRRAEQVNRVLYAIANAVNVTPDLDKLYQVIHRNLHSIINTTNFFIAIVNREKKTLYFPYSVDTVDDDFSPITDFDTGNSLTGLVVLCKEPLLLREAELNERALAQGVWGPVPRIWLGVPLLVRGEITGVIAVQSYTDPAMYGEEDLQLLAAVSHQIALAIDRKQSLDELRRSEQRFRQLFEQSNDAILIYDRHGAILDCNHRASEMFGYPRPRLLELQLFDLHFEEESETIRQALRTTEEGGQHRYEAGCRSRHGARLEVEVSARVIDLGGDGAIQAMIRDVTERKRAERQLLQNEQKYRNLFYNAEVGLFRSSPDTDDLLECNDALVQMAGYDNRQEFLNHFSLGRAYLDREARKALLFELRRTGRIENRELPMRRRDGSIGWYRCTATYNQEENWIEGVVVDISEMKRATEEKLELEQQLERSRRMEALGMLAGGVAHDLNNILAGIISYPELLLLKYGDDPELKRPLAAILEAGNRAAMIVADMLVIARSAANVMEPADIHTLIGEYLDSPEFHALTTRHPQVRVKTDFGLANGFISCAPVQVKKCLMNLVANGCEAIAGDGEVVLATRRAESVAQDGGEMIELVVRDTGGGIAPKDIKHIFEPFYSRKIMGRSGTGLGLTVVWNTVQNHGGTIRVESDAGGTTFLLTLPAAAPPEAAAGTAAGESRICQGRGETVLVVDDERQLREIACQLLMAMGYRCQAVDSGEAALGWLEENRADLVLLDMLMEPGMNGAETYARIIERYPGQKAVVASGYSESIDIETALRLGVATFIRKPYTMERLSQAVHGALHGSAHPDEA